MMGEKEDEEEEDIVPVTVLDLNGEGKMIGRFGCPWVWVCPARFEG